MISNGQVQAYSGQGRFLGNFAAFLFVFIMLLGSAVALNFWDLDYVWIPGLLFLGLYSRRILRREGDRRPVGLPRAPGSPR
ncbi:hypothetical protein [Nesterenkonia pannonica]|uniref:hypothetical protein n=1 Tax=Nesterenkonia pannonica TaxID=1548602 RepID=UPI0021646927|nr:hypothetical protein [Nesterenkonia pannonica]